MKDKKALLLLLGEKLKGRDKKEKSSMDYDDEDEKESLPEELEDLSKEILEALKSEDPKELAESLYAFFCESHDLKY